MIKKLLILVVMIVSMGRVYAQGSNGVYQFSTPSNLETTIKDFVADLVPSVTFPDGVIDIPSKIEYNNKTYTVTDIEGGFGKNLDWVTKVIFPESVTRIGNNVFQNCPNLTTVIIKGNVVELQNQFLYNCNNIQTIIIEGNTPDVTSFAKNICSSNSGNTNVNIYLSQATSDKNWVNTNTSGNVTVAGSVDDSNRTDASSGTGAFIYKRTFGTTQWQPWYENFDMAYNDWKNDFDMAELVNIHTYHDGSWLLELDLLGEGSSVKANIPYMVRAKSKGDKSLFLTNSTKVAFTSNTITCKSTENTYKFIGNIEAKSKFIVDGLYAVSAGALKKVVGNGVNLKAGRWYLILENRLSQVTDTPSEVRIRLKGEADADIEADEITGIFSASNNNVKTESYYTTSGVRINKPRTGINIIRMSDGTTRKVIIK